MSHLETKSDDDISRAAAFVAPAVRPRVGLVLGSGLGGFADALEDARVVPYSSIPGMPVSEVAGHAGNLCLGTLGGVPVACLQGRVHLYEGHPVRRVVFGVRLLAKLGCQVVLLTNAAGGVHSALRPGDLMVLTDHINLLGQNPLVGPAGDEGPRFLDQTRAYDQELHDLAHRAGEESGVGLASGVYAALLGPTYETPAEVRMLRVLGADAVGMSTVPEVIALRHLGVRVGAISCITNLAAGLSPEPLSHEEVGAVAERSRERFTAVMGRWVTLIGSRITS